VGWDGSIARSLAVFVVGIVAGGTLSQGDAWSQSIPEPVSTDQSGRLSPGTDLASSAGPPEEARLERPRVRISIGHHTVAPGALRYPVRSEVSGSGVMVAFSAVAPLQTRNGSLTLPARLPLSAAPVTSRFGFRAHPIRGGWQPHWGVDMAAPAGAPIVATMDGVVGSAGWAGGYGWRIDLLHEGGVQTRYAHLSSFNVSTGQTVKQGDVIGFVGSTGNSTGPHLHYEVRVDGIAVDPLAP
jgi:murein DD-endopeptidase MepM/ murein hydrolase activator NlpD